jgi:hypothetical protein
LAVAAYRAVFHRLIDLVLHKRCSELPGMESEQRGCGQVSDLDPLVALLRRDGVPFLVRGHADGSCSLFANIPGNAITVRVVADEYASVKDLCADNPWDLCSST